MLHDLPSSELVTHGRAILDWIAEYLEHPERYPVLSRVVPGEIRAMLPTSAPRAGESLEAILRDFEGTIVPGITHWNHPGFFAYFSISASVPGILGELLTAALDVNGMLWKTSPAATELEETAMDWLRQLIGLPGGWFGTIQDTASISSLVALAAAREAKPELAIRERGMAGRTDLPRLRVYCSEHAHSSIDKAALTLGIGLENVVHVGCDAEFRMNPALLRNAMAQDRASGLLPIACVATVGTTSIASVDPVRAIAAICADEGVWLHVDGAYGGVAAVVPELRGVLDGVEYADSLVVNPHKWLFTPIDCSAFYTRKADIVKRAFSLLPDYLVTPEQEAVVNLMDYGVSLGKRFRALKLWMVIRAFGADGLAERIRRHCELARLFGGWVAEQAEWQVMAPVSFSLVCFRYAPVGVHEEALNALNERIVERVNASGEVYVSHTKLSGRYTIRLAVGNIRTEAQHVRRAWELLRAAASDVESRSRRTSEREG